MRGVDFTGIAFLVAIGLVGAVGYLAFANRKELTNLVNPASDKNVVNRGVTAAGQALSGDKNWTLGGWIYELTHPGENKRIRDMLRGSPAPADKRTAFQKSLSDVWL